MNRVKDWGTRKDANHNQVVRWFKDLMCVVKETHAIPGFVDLVIKRGSQIRLIEIKDPNQPPSQRKLTRAEKEFWKMWGTDPLIVETMDDVIRVVDGMKGE